MKTHHSLKSACMRYIFSHRSCAVFEEPSHSQNGMVLFIVLFWLALSQVVTLSSFNRSTLQIRSLRAHYDAIQARHAAHAGKVLCTQLLENSQIIVHPWNETTEPAYWRMPGVFDGHAPAAHFVTSSWPGSIRPPQCLVEHWTLPDKPTSSFYLITTKGFGATEQAVAWEQEMRWTEKKAKDGEGENKDEEKWQHTQRPLRPL